MVIVLPTIYIVGNLIIREILDKEYEEIINDINEGIEEMEAEMGILEEENRKLKGAANSNEGNK